MCLIIAKDKDIKFEHEFVKECIENSSVKNDDGFGYAINLGKKGIKVRKGFKSASNLIRSLAKLDQAMLDKNEVIIHLRNASPNTDINMSTTHPIVSDLETNKQQRFVLKKGQVVFHNGSISEFRGYHNCIHGSDTLGFVKEYFVGEDKKGYDLFSYLKKYHKSKLKEFFGFNNKIIIMSVGEETLTFGHFNEPKDHKGYYFSNYDYDKAFKERYLRNKEDKVTTSRTWPKQKRGTRVSGFGGSRNNAPTDLFDHVSSHDTADFNKVASGSRQSLLGKNQVNTSDEAHSVSFRVIAAPNSTDLSQEYTVYHRKAPTRDSNLKVVYGKIPFSCMDNSEFTNKCPLQKDDGKYCCQNAKLKQKNKESYQIRKEIGEIVRKKAWLNPEYKFTPDQIDVLNFIYDKKDVMFTWYECNVCKGKFHDYAPCSTCGNLLAELRFGILRFEKGSNKLYISDAIELTESYDPNFTPVVSAAHEATVTAQEIKTALIDIAKKRITKARVARISAE